MTKNKLKIGALILIVVTLLIVYKTAPSASGETYFERGQKSFIAATETDVIEDSLFEDAIDNYEKAIDKGVKKRAVFSNLSKSYFYNQDHQNAERILTEGIKFYPNEAEFYFYRASCKKDLKEYKGALLDYDKCVNLGDAKNTDFVKDAIYGRGAMRYLFGDFVNAEKDWKLAQLKTDYELRTYKDYCQLFK